MEQSGLKRNWLIELKTRFVDCLARIPVSAFVHSPFRSGILRDLHNYQRGGAIWKALDNISNGVHHMTQDFGQFAHVPGEQQPERFAPNALP